MATFFFSYARRNVSTYLDVFAKDLRQLLCDRIGRYEEDVLFMDRGMEPGKDWTQEIREALRTCRVFLSVESPAYFQSDYCGKEWRAFHQRLEEHARATRKPAPPLHIRIRWLSILESQLRNLPPAVQKIQDTREVLNRYFEQLVRAHPGEPYQTALTRLVDLVIAALEKYSLPPADEIPNVSEIESAFRSSGRVGPVQSEVTGVGHVRFGVVAGVQEEALRFREPADSYGSGPVDWKPFHPDVPRPIGPLAQGVAASQNLTSNYLQMNGSLQVQLSDAEGARNLVVFLVDPWALEMEQYRELVRLYDDMHCLNCSLLIPWPSDAQTRSWRTKLLDRMRATLAKTAQREPGSYREEIDSFERLESELIKAITNATARMVELMEVTRRVESDRTITMPLLSGPSGANDAR